MRDKLFAPLGMNHTGGGILDRFPNHATGYNGVDGNTKPGVCDVQEFGWPSGGHMYIFAPERGDSLIMIRNFAGKAAIQPPANQIMAVVLGIKDVGRGTGGDDQGQ